MTLYIIHNMTHKGITHYYGRNIIIIIDKVPYNISYYIIMYIYR